MKAIAVLLLVFSLFSVGAEPATQQTALVRGMITDWLTGAAVPRATVRFESATATYTVLTANDGSYQAQLPVDFYRIRVSRMTYCSVRRAAARIGTLVETNFDFRLAPCAVKHVGILADGQVQGEEAQEVNPLEFDTFWISSSTNAPGELLVRFGTKREDPRFIDYEGAQIPYTVRDGNSKETHEEYKYLGVMLTYNLLTIYADFIKLRKEDFRIEANGNVIVEDGSSRTRASAVRIKLRGDPPVVDLLRYAHANFKINSD